VKLARTLLTALLPLLLTSCSVPLGPGYTIERQQILLTYSPQSPGRVHLTSTYRLKNTGTRDLDSIRAALPLEFKNLRVTAAAGPERSRGTATALLPGPVEKGEHAAIVPLPFSSPLVQKAGLELVLEYDLEISAETFYFPYSGWFAELRPPEAFLAKGDPRANKIDFTVRVPENFRVLSGGLARGPKKRSPRQSRGGAERDFRFLLREDDFDLFVLAGPYVEQQVRSAEGTFVFWTLEEHPKEQVDRAAARLAATLKLYQDAFGPRDPLPRPIWLVEQITYIDRASGEEEEDPSARSFPHGVLLNRIAVAIGLADDDSLSLAERELAEHWFQQLASPGSYADGSLGDSLPRYAVLCLQASREGDALRQRRIAESLLDYDQAASGKKETPLVNMAAASPEGTHAVAFYKAELLLYALEDKVGQKVMQYSIRRMVQALRGSTYGYAELRSALETESGQDLGEMFRAWLTQPGIPEEFRKRYSGAERTP